MNIICKTPMDKMIIIERWQYYLSKKHQEIEKLYYPLIDDLTQKLGDTNGIDANELPDFDLHQFSYLRDWMDGKVDSQYVLTILRTNDFKKVAEAKITRRLTNYMFRKETVPVADHIKYVRAELLKTVAPMYEVYMKMLLSYFEKLTEIDRKQEKITWIEQDFIPGAAPILRIEDLTLNQAVRQLEFYVEPYNDSRYAVSENLVVFDEETAKGGRKCHWIFAPQAYIGQIKHQFKIKDVMDLKEERGYIQNIIGAFIK